MAEDPIIRVAIHGAAGQMGQRLLQGVDDDPQLHLVAAVDRPGHARLGEQLAPGVTLVDRFDADADVVVDFSSPDATVKLVDHCAARGCALVIGTTGLTAAVESAIDEAAASIAVLPAANFSLVVVVLHLLAARAAALLGDDYDIEILEAHHRFKADAPSGTALALAQTLCAATGRSFDRDVVLARHGHDARRQSHEITIQALRIGDHTGEHTVYLAGSGERLELRHVSTNRDSYARGALRAAKWLASRPPGRYTMNDVVGVDQVTAS